MMIISLKNIVANLTYMNVGEIFEWEMIGDKWYPYTHWSVFKVSFGFPLHSLCMIGKVTNGFWDFYRSTSRGSSMATDFKGSSLRKTDQLALLKKKKNYGRMYEPID